MHTHSHTHTCVHTHPHSCMYAHTHTIFFLSESSWFYCLHNKVSLELDHLALSLLITSQFKMLASLNSQHPLRSAVGLHTFQSQHNLLCSFRLFAENRLSLPTIATLFPVITPLSLGIQRIFALLVLCHFVGLVLAAFLAECPAGLRNVHHVGGCDFGTERSWCLSSWLKYQLLEFSCKLISFEILS